MYLLLNAAGYIVGRPVPGLLFNDTKTPLIGAWAGVLGVVAACAYIAPNVQVQLLFPPMPIRIKLLAYFYLGVDVSHFSSAAVMPAGKRLTLGGPRPAPFSSGTPTFSATSSMSPPTRGKNALGRPAPRRTPLNCAGSAEDEEREVNRILDKVKAEGINSLTGAEKDVLAQGHRRPQDQPVTTGPLEFEVVAPSASCSGRCGRVSTPHGLLDTPAFMPVGTRGSVKGILPHMLAELGAQIVLNNTYHLMLRPGAETIQKLGGVHRFMNWAGPILTDSGGCRAFSLADTNTVNDKGSRQVHHRRAPILLTPELAMQVQNQLGPDIMMALDDCPPSIAPEAAERDEAQRRRVLSDVTRDSAKGQRSKRYDQAERLKTKMKTALRSSSSGAKPHDRPTDQALFGITQGGADLARRAWCRGKVTAIDLPGYAIRDVAVGESPEVIAQVVAHTAPLLPASKPRYLMGVGYRAGHRGGRRQGWTCSTASSLRTTAAMPTHSQRPAKSASRTTSTPWTASPSSPDATATPATQPPVRLEDAGRPPIQPPYLRHLFRAGGNARANPRQLA